MQNSLCTSIHTILKITISTHTAYVLPCLPTPLDKSFDSIRNAKASACFSVIGGGNTGNTTTSCSNSLSWSADVSLLVLALALAVLLNKRVIIDCSLDSPFLLTFLKRVNILTNKLIETLG